MLQLPWPTSALVEMVRTINCFVMNIGSVEIGCAQGTNKVGMRSGLLLETLIIHIQINSHCGIRCWLTESESGIP